VSLFLLLFFLLYGGMHFHAYRKITGAFSLPLPAAVLLIFFMGVMVCAPLLVRLAEREGLESVAAPLAYAGYLWMGILFLFFTTSVFMDGVRLLFRCSGFLSHGAQLTDRQAFLASLFVSLGIAVYGFYEAGDIRTEKVVIRTHKLPRALARLTLVQISDVHLGLIIKERRLQAIVRVIENAQPDVLVSTGDLVDGQMDGMETLAAELQKLKPVYGKFAVTGNHEYYAGIEKSLVFTRLAGFSVLRGESQDVGGVLTIAGVDDPAAERAGILSRGERDILEKIPVDRFVLLLKHRPVLGKESVGRFDLQLSGHVHKGQIFPFSVLTRLVYPVATGLSHWGVSALYVSRGTGTWGPPIRFLAPPEVTVIELVRTGEGV
jgi:predicted MPP superfamily phosphohydrolase